MAVTMSIILAGLLVAWFAFFYLTSRWPLRVEKHNVFCPVYKKPARVSLAHNQVIFGAYMPTDVSSCSLLPRGEMSCDRLCMR